MGMVCSLTRVSAELLERILAAAAEEDEDAVSELVEAGESDDYPGWRDGIQSGYLDKSWEALQYLFDRADLPVDLTWDGELLVFGGTSGCAWDADEDLQDLRSFHAELVRFVERTAAEGSALLVLVG